MDDLTASGHHRDSALYSAGVDVFLHDFVDVFQALGRHADRLCLGHRHLRWRVHWFGKGHSAPAKQRKCE